MQKEGNITITTQKRVINAMMWYVCVHAKTQERLYSMHDCGF